ncbi:MAG TPA: NAD(P)-dependent alcohol dehydrogenase, partial [Pyrinomonadaceae bacterium]|nr:NAD(P)-dependent alcohol dehydrogenase [Pyrinomonadaceae bacterium]
GGTTLGGYSESIVVDERFVLKVPEKLDISKAAPLLCAGITTYSPMKHWKVGPNKRVGIVGLGGLGHMAVKFSHSFGAETVVFTTSERKFEDAIKLGADKVILSSDSDEMKKLSGSFDFIIDCVSSDHDINAYINLLKCDGNITIVGAPEKPLSVHAFSLIFGRRSFSGSPIGGIPETQEMLDYCAEKNILPETELITIDKINEAYDRMLKGDVRYRFVIDIDSLRKSN